MSYFLAEFIFEENSGIWNLRSVQYSLRLTTTNVDSVRNADCEMTAASTNLLAAAGHIFTECPPLDEQTCQAIHWDALHPYSLHVEAYHCSGLHCYPTSLLQYKWQALASWVSYRIATQVDTLFRVERLYLAIATSGCFCICSIVNTRKHGIATHYKGELYCWTFNVRIKCYSILQLYGSIT